METKGYIYDRSRYGIVETLNRDGSPNIVIERVKPWKNQLMKFRDRNVNEIFGILFIDI
jgi:hypothetical protein